ncbi:hypothetical protein HUW46_09312 [Amycolatopsis sp. CA-230715]|nr:hypothetical protein HUW46_09312 [Amycolatopsis sp. CA-230715]
MTAVTEAASVRADVDPRNDAEWRRGEGELLDRF